MQTLPALVSSWCSQDEENTQQFPAPRAVLATSASHIPPQSQFQSMGWSSSAVMDFGSGLWVPKSGGMFSTGAELLLLTGKTKAQWKNTGFPFKNTGRRDRNKEVLWLSTWFSFLLLWLLNVLSQFPAPSEGILSRETQRSPSHLLSVLGVGGL